MRLKYKLPQRIKKKIRLGYCTRGKKICKQKLKHHNKDRLLKVQTIQRHQVASGGEDKEMAVSSFCSTCGPVATVTDSSLTGH